MTHRKSNAPSVVVFIAIGLFMSLALISTQQESFGSVRGMKRDDPDFERFLRAIEKVESHGNPKAVSKKGARGRFQIMPATAKKPGTGVTPLRNSSDAEQERFARDYVKALLKHYQGDKDMVAAAYNAGTGRIDRLMAMLPKETKEYVVKVDREYAANGG